MQEEIDVEALQCLSTQDLQAIGVRDPTHRRKLLSAALQLQSATLAHIPLQPGKEPITGASAEAQHAQHACPQMPGEAVPSICSNAARIDKQALPASARDSQATVQPVSSKANTSNSSSSSRSCTLHHAAPDKTSSAAPVLAQPANKSRKIRQLQTAGQPAYLAGTDAVHGHLLGPSSDSASTSETTHILPVHRAVNTAVSVLGTDAKGSSKQRHSAMPPTPAMPAAPVDMVAGSSAPSEMHAPARSAAACVDAKGSVVAPQSRADEEHQLALALSASMGEPLEGQRPPRPMCGMHAVIPALSSNADTLAYLR